MYTSQELATNPGTQGLPSHWSQLSLFPVKEVEIDGVQMGVLNDGTPYLTAKGLARMCGVDVMSIQRTSLNWPEEKTKPRGVILKKLLEAQGYDLEALCLMIPQKTGNSFAYPDPVCMAFLEYYAFESARGANEVAIRNYRLLARHSFRTFIYNRCGYDPNKNIPDSWRNFHERVLLNDSVPINYFSIFREIADIVVHLIQSGCPLDDHTVPDVSVGMMWAKHWSDSEFDTKFGPRQKFPHNYPEWFPQSKANPVPAWIYPMQSLGEFRIWLYDNYIKTNFPKYVENKLKAGDFLPPQARLLMIAVNQKGVTAQPPVGSLPPSP